MNFLLRSLLPRTFGRQSLILNSKYQYQYQYQYLYQNAAWSRTIKTCTPKFASTQQQQSTENVDDILLAAARKALATTKKSVENSSSSGERAKQTSRAMYIEESLEEIERRMKELEGLDKMMQDPELRELALNDVDETNEAINEIRDRLKKFILPAQENSPKAAIVEIKSGIGGDEAGMFAGELFKMYSKFFLREKLQAKVLDKNKLTNVDGYRDIIIEVKGKNVYERLKFENGVHRVQRVPVNQTQDKIQTSTSVVIVLPANDKPPTKEDDIINMKDVRVDVMRAGGAGGQHVNTTESAVRMVHLPTGLSAMIQESRSQHENRSKAYMVLRAKLLDKKMREEQEAKNKERRSAYKGMDRTFKIRTYNYVQDRVTDHRLPLTVHGLNNILAGGDKLKDIVDRLQERDIDEQLRELVEESNEASSS